MDEEVLQKIEHYLAGRLSPEEVRAFEGRLQREPFLARIVDLYLLGEGPLDQLLPLFLGIPRPVAAAEPHPPRLWLLSLLTGTMLVGMNGRKNPRRQKKDAGRRISDEEEHPGPG